MFHCFLYNDTCCPGVTLECVACVACQTPEEFCLANPGYAGCDAYDVVEKLRAGWLRSRGPNSVSDPSPAYPTIYVDGTRRGEMDMLRTISVMDIQEIDFLSTQEANLRYGQGHFGGIIHVTTKR